MAGVGGGEVGDGDERPCRLGGVETAEEGARDGGWAEESRRHFWWLLGMWAVAGDEKKSRMEMESDGWLEVVDW